MEIYFKFLPLWDRILASPQCAEQPRSCFGRDVVAFASYLRGSRPPSKARAWHIVLSMFWPLERSLLVCIMTSALARIVQPDRWNR